MGTLNRSMSLFRSGAARAITAMTAKQEAASVAADAEIMLRTLLSPHRSGKRQGSRASHAENRANRQAKLRARREARAGMDDEMRLTLDVRRQVRESMTNWQATQWMKAGCPRKIKDMRRFASMSHPRSTAVAQ